MGACPHFSGKYLAVSNFVLVITTGLLDPILHLRLKLKCLVHLSASHFGLAVDHLSEIRLALFEAEVYGRSNAVIPLGSRETFAMWTVSSFPGMPVCLETQ